ncbi:MAG: ORF6N domain-containing protein [Bacteroidetes bacterium]|nr:ORF6N domain-containing protein [Bacteroidota bacterium]
MQLATIQTKIYEIRGQKVMLDFDLAELYEVETRALNQAVKRNIRRFPEDFMFQVTGEEYASLRSQFVTLEILGLQNEASNKGRGKHTKYLPYAFTEQGVAMLSGILKSVKAIDVNISIMRAFVFIRQYALSHNDLTTKLLELESKYDKQFKDVYEAITFLLQKDNQETEQKQRRRIGYHKL